MNTTQFTKISAKVVDKLELKTPISRKYWFQGTWLQELLDTITDAYYLLEIKGNSHLHYASRYYVSKTKSEGKLNTHKIRRINYSDSKISFLEVKARNSRGKASVKHILSDYDRQEFTEQEINFINVNTGLKCEDLRSTFSNEFVRLTFVHKEFKEVFTLDVDLKYHFKDADFALGNLVIVKLRSEADFLLSPMVQEFQKRSINQSKFGKYKIGRDILADKLRERGVNTNGELSNHLNDSAINSIISN